MAETTPDKPFLQGQGDLAAGARAIRSIQWGPEEMHSLRILSRDDLRAVLRRALTGEVPLAVVQEWADAIEGRNDLVEYENQIVADVLFELATPEVNGDLTVERIEELLPVLS